jgi:hypothetical protein
MNWDDYFLSKGIEKNMNGICQCERDLSMMRTGRMQASKFMRESMQITASQIILSMILVSQLPRWHFHVEGLLELSHNIIHHFNESTKKRKTPDTLGTTGDQEIRPRYCYANDGSGNPLLFSLPVGTATRFPARVIETCI